MNGRKGDMEQTILQNTENDSDQPVVYEIKVQGSLDRQWAAWFAGLAIKQGSNGETILSGPVTDQSALHGLLKKVRDLGLPLLLVRRIDPGAPDGQK